MSLSRFSQLRRLTCLLTVVIAGCSQPAWRQALPPAIQETVETGTEFRHRVLFKPGHGTTLHIYLHGDGRLWRTPSELFPDPTPPRPLALELLLQDPAPSLLVGRPCYFQTKDHACKPRWWTSARYSAPVLDSMLAVIRKWSSGYDRVVLIGHSGGGALAMLLAPRLADVSTVVTIAGNLDVGAWLRHHGYGSAVAGESLDPAKQPPLPSEIAQYHYVGGNDDKIRWEWIKAFSERQGAHFYRLDGFGHHCCWEQRWPELLKRSGLD